VSADVSKYVEEDISYVLWNFTPYPMGTRAQVATALERYLTDPAGVEEEIERMFVNSDENEGDD
jgi:hypothetical protein